MKQVSSNKNYSLDSFGELLKKFQKRRKLSGEKCAEIIGVSPECWRMYCASKRHPKKITVLKIAILLECNIEETEALLRSCEYHFVQYDVVDQIIIKAINRNAYNLNQINRLIEIAEKNVGNMNPPRYFS